MTKIILITATLVSVASALFISSPIAYGDNSTSPQELQEVKKVIQKVIIPIPKNALSCDTGEPINISQEQYKVHLMGFSDYQFEVTSDTYLLKSRKGMLSSHDSHYRLNADTITTAGKRYFCIRRSYEFNPIFSQKTILENRKEPKNVETDNIFTRFFSLFRM